MEATEAGSSLTEVKAAKHKKVTFKKIQTKAWLFHICLHTIFSKLITSPNHSPSLPLSPLPSSLHLSPPPSPSLPLSPPPSHSHPHSEKLLVSSYRKFSSNTLSYSTNKIGKKKTQTKKSL